MENRVSRFITPLLIGLIAYLLIGQFFSTPDPKNTAQESAVRPLDAGRKTAALQTSEPKAIEKQFATELGEPGFHVEFHTRGGGIKWVDLLDYFSTPNKRLHDDEHLYRVIAFEPGVFSFAIEDFLGLFPVEVGDKLRRVEHVDWLRVATTPENEVAYELALANGLTIRKSFRFFKGQRHFQIAVKLIDRGKTATGEKSALPEAWTYRLRGASVLNNPSDEFFMNPATVFAMPEGGEELLRGGPKSAPDDPDLPDVFVRTPSTGIAWAGSSSRFFTSILWPDDADSKAALRAVEVRSLPYDDDGVPKTKAYTNVAAVFQLTQRIVPYVENEAKASELVFNCYLGPKSRDILEDDADYARFLPVCDLDLATGCFCAPGAEPLAKMLLWVLKLFQSLVGNWGIAIIILTVCVRGAMLPLMLRQGRAMRSYSQRMTKLKPEMDRIKKKHEKDPKKMNAELMAFQRQHKLFPPLMGCLPMFLTMPVFIGLFTMLRATFELRHQPFFGWIDDLSLPDRAMRLGLTDLPLLGNFFEYLNVLPIIMAVLWGANMFGQALPEDPQQRSMQRMMRFMPFVFVFFLYNYAAGLALYMCVSALWTLVEQRIQRAKYGAQATAGMPTPM